MSGQSSGPPTGNRNASATAKRPQKFGGWIHTLQDEVVPAIVQSYTNVRRK